MVRPDQDVVLASGDGFFSFGTPDMAIWAASFHKAPYLSVVLSMAGSCWCGRRSPPGAMGCVATSPQQRDAYAGPGVAALALPEWGAKIDNRKRQAYFPSAWRGFYGAIGLIRNVE